MASVHSVEFARKQIRRLVARSRERLAKLEEELADAQVELTKEQENLQRLLHDGRRFGIEDLTASGSPPHSSSDPEVGQPAVHPAP